MRIGGVDFEREWEPEPLVLGRGKKFLVFRARPVFDLDEFKTLCPPPDTKRFGRFEKGKGFVADPDAPAYKEAVRDHNLKYWHFLMIRSLEPSEIEWKNVKPNDPATWKHVRDDLLSVLHPNEYVLVESLVMEANALDESKLTENRKSFFQQQSAGSAPPTNSRADEAESTASSELVSASESSPQV